jgi:hypothetical protein
VFFVLKGKNRTMPTQSNVQHAKPLSKPEKEYQCCLLAKPCIGSTWAFVYFEYNTHAEFVHNVCSTAAIEGGAKLCAKANLNLLGLVCKHVKQKP